MFLIQKISADPYQSQTLLLEDGSALPLVLYFRSLQYGWFIEELTYLDFTLRALRITNSPNMLQQWRNKLPFGLGCFSTANREPSQQEDFSSGASKLYLLSAAEVAEYTRFLQGG